MKRSPSHVPGDPLLAVAYLRVSTEEQSLGPEAQRAAIEQWAQRQGVCVRAWHTDHITGALELEHRPALLAALVELREAGAGILAVAKRDRLARDVPIALAIETAAARAGAIVVSADGSGNGETPIDRFTRLILDGIAQLERAMIRKRTREALAVLRARGDRSGAIPYGQRLAPDGAHHLQLGRRLCAEACAGCRHLEPDPDELAITLGVRALLAGGLSLRATVRALAGAGIVSRAGRPLGLTQIARLARGHR